MAFQLPNIKAKVRLFIEILGTRLRFGSEAKNATEFWGSLPEYHMSNDKDPYSILRSQWLANEIVPQLGLKSLLEVGTNSGRNLEYIRSAHADIELKGIDVNPNAIEFARQKGLDITFELSDANQWAEPASRWDAILTMSVLDHIPNEVIDQLAANIAFSAKHIIAVELWDGRDATRGAYKYSRDNRKLFEKHGFETIMWQRAPGQYDTDSSVLWVYIGRQQ